MSLKQTDDDLFLDSLSRKGPKGEESLLTKEQVQKLMTLPVDERPGAMREMLNMERVPNTKRSDDTI